MVEAGALLDLLDSSGALAADLAEQVGRGMLVSVGECLDWSTSHSELLIFPSSSVSCRHGREGTPTSSYFLTRQQSGNNSAGPSEVLSGTIIRQGELLTLQCVMFLP